MKLEEIEEIILNSPYTKYYCEQNVYKAVQQLNKKQVQPYVVFLTSKNQKTYIREQKSGQALFNHIVIWDYHVILLIKFENQYIVFDKDSRLWKVNLKQYFIKALKTKSHEPPIVFRVIKGQQFIDHFSSDRSHMFSNGVYNEIPPIYQCIVNKNQDKMNLNKYLDCQNKQKEYGEIFNQKEFLQYFK